MIIVENITRTYQAKIEFDQYVPLNIEFGEKNTMEDSLMYWRTGSLTDTLMEVGIGRKSKRIYSITLVLCHHRNVVPKKHVKKKGSYSVTEGCLTFVNNSGDVMYVDEKRELTVYLGDNTIDIFWEDNEIVHCVKNENIYFFIDSNMRWIGLRIENIYKGEMSTFCKSLSM